MLTPLAREDGGALVSPIVHILAHTPVYFVSWTEEESIRWTTSYHRFISSRRVHKPKTLKVR
jgi:hypothetical protein